MTEEQIIQEASKAGITINELDIDTWLRNFATEEQKSVVSDTGEYPNDISFKDIEDAGKQLIAF